ncbi:MAG TPA: hypothetical protein PK014_03370 [Thermoanaerobaculia bacterium]|nr:hypothetical protein [Thermoanaerobaculia bacterium]HXK67564.1 hypothetical protein [Thermoanaerobaculia bacterium]
MSLVLSQAFLVAFPGPLFPYSYQDGSLSIHSTQPLPPLHPSSHDPHS